MSTIDLGKIKMVYRGVYDNSTAYTVDDVVQHTDSGLTSSFICTTNSTGNAPSTGGTVHGSWSYLAKGGVAGTDVGTTLTTQGDILYRDGSGLQRLAAGTSGQVLQTGGAGANPSWGTVSSDYVKIARYSATGVSASSYNFENIFDASVYSRYQIHGYINKSSAGSQIRGRFLNGSTAYSGTYDYNHGGFDAYRQTNQASNTIGASNDGDGRDYIQMIAWGNNSSYGTAFDMWVEASQLVNGEYKFSVCHSRGRDDSSPSYVYYSGFGHHTSFTGLVNGIQFFTGDGNGLGQVNITIYGEKI